ncbi:20S proteasome maturation factor [Yamadazyma tenuis]|uniref:Proteasome maturation factor UMP1 n=1 Tax=Candida tenuis (strain ATCC 10573 / BCRC 21748 / CBS 615 / JCM 9827 / NBRC 10315 / NRRL Y-1498 / VKM Y-70) TaxID=590646 RepID=G3BB24_CANTC|nr:proteasome maturation factor UMP1 [Yamadazyma tenuis ATCC 10573]EGV62124.1 proteasome maturation factor UMP1 [Yamadazyma tenuis ATCC 10573]WEJ93378.1 20S proteasome maturation factor [Yamadazyma tenuis]
MSLRIVPDNNHQSTINHAEVGDKAAHAPGFSDMLRSQQGPASLASQINNRHPLESRLGNWEETQHQTRLESYRRVFGAGEPIKRTMELGIVEATDFKPEVLGGSTITEMHKDILLNKDASVDWEDVYKQDVSGGYTVKDFHSEMERKMGIN